MHDLRFLVCPAFASARASVFVAHCQLDSGLRPTASPAVLHPGSPAQRKASTNHSQAISHLLPALVPLLLDIVGMLQQSEIVGPNWCSLRNATPGWRGEDGVLTWAPRPASRCREHQGLCHRIAGPPRASDAAWRSSGTTTKGPDSACCQCKLARLAFGGRHLPRTQAATLAADTGCTPPKPQQSPTTVTVWLQTPHVLLS